MSGIRNWQRATYFWALIAATFAGYFAILSAEHILDRAFDAFVVACIGLVFSLAWFLANRGSKFWQENWEQHVDMLEDNIAGPLYKTVLTRPTPKKWVERWIDGPLPVSVSKINQWTSLFTVSIWPVLAWNVLPAFDRGAPVSIKHVVVVCLTLGACGALIKFTKSKLGGHKVSLLIERTATIEDKGG